MVDLNTNTVSFGDTTVKLSAQQAEFLYTVVEKSPGVATREHIASRLWPIDDAPLTSSKAMDVRACQVRRLTGHMGFGLETVWGTGYRLVMP